MNDYLNFKGSHFLSASDTGDGSVCSRLTDEQAKRIIEMSSGCSNASEFQQLSECDKEEYLNEFKNKGLSIRQVSRLTGVSFGLVRKFY